MEVEARIAAGFAEALRADLTRSAYLERYLATHIGSSGLWSELDQKVLDLVDPDTVRMEAFRKAYGRTVLPPAVLVTMLVADKLATIDPASRGLVRALAAHRLRITGAGVSDPALWWCRLSPVVPHITLSGHTGWVVGVVFGQVEGRTLLATAGYDETVRLWAVDGRSLESLLTYCLAPSSCAAVAVTADAVFVGCNDGVVALQLPESRSYRGGKISDE